MRDVSLSDMGQILSWRNSEAGVKYSKSTSPIPLSQHEGWYELRILRNPREPYLIFSIEKQDIGSVRFDFDPSNSTNFVTNIILNPEFIGRGYGSRMLSMAIDYVVGSYPEIELIAEIHNQNFASIKVFLNNQFMLIDKREMFGIYRFISRDQFLK